MIPPIDNAILEANPKFAQLHKTLTTKYLNPDGGTKNHPAQAERDARSAELHALRQKATRAHILRTALADLPLTAPASTTPPTTKGIGKGATARSGASETPDTPLPADLTELIILLTLYLRTTSLTPSSTALLTNSPAYLTLPTHLPTISALLSTHLTTLALPLTRLLHPTTNPSFLHRNIPTLPSSIQTLRTAISTKRTHLSSARTALTASTIELLKLYTAQSEAIIRILEQTTHGALARHSRAHADLLRVSCATACLDAKHAAHTVRGIVYDPPATAALRAYAEHLRDGRARLLARKKDVERELRGYGVGRDDGGRKEKVMVEIARVWEEMMAEVEEVRRDIERLKRG